MLDKVSQLNWLGTAALKWRSSQVPEKLYNHWVAVVP